MLRARGSARDIALADGRGTVQFTSLPWRARGASRAIEMRFGGRTGSGDSAVSLSWRAAAFARNVAVRTPLAEALQMRKTAVARALKAQSFQVLSGAELTVLLSSPDAYGVSALSASCGDRIVLPSPYVLIMAAVKPLKAEVVALALQAPWLARADDESMVTLMVRSVPCRACAIQRMRCFVSVIITSMRLGGEVCAYRMDSASKSAVAHGAVVCSGRVSVLDAMSHRVSANTNTNTKYTCDTGQPHNKLLEQ